MATYTVTMTDNRAEQLGKRVLALREARHWTQAELARRAFIGRSYVAHIEDGKNMPSVDVIDRVASALGTTASMLLSGADPDVRSPEEVGATVLEEVIKAVQGVPIRVIGRVPADTLRIVDLEEMSETRPPVYLSQQQLGGARAPFAVEISGDCFRSHGIYDGDIVICDRAQEREPEDWDLVLVRLNGETTFKRWRLAQGRHELRDGDDETVHVIVASDRVEVLGFYVTYIPGPR